MSTKLAPHQIAQSVYDAPNEAIRTTIQNMEIAIELSADDGDSVITIPKTINVYNAVNGPQPTHAVIIPATNVSFCNRVAIIVNNADGPTGLTFEVSPSDTDDVWHSIGTHNAPSGISHHEPTFFPCRRIRIKFTNTYSNPALFQVWLNGRA